MLISIAMAAALLVLPLAPQAPAGTLESIQVHSPALEGNRLGDPADQAVYVYLPPSYDTAGQTRFATLYLLHGFDGRPAEWTDHGYQGMSLRDTMDQLVASHAIHEMIVVVPNGRNAYGGGFYTNSSVGGGWEDFIARDLVASIDGRYRTIAEAESRGVTGHSMGGYGAIMLGMNHPEVFGAVYAMSPCCLDLDSDLTATNPAWHAALAVKSRDQIVDPRTLDRFYVNAFVAMAAAFSPDPARGPLLVDFPYCEQNGTLVPSQPAWGKWHEHLPVEIAASHVTNLLALRGLSIDYGMEDDFAHIPITSRRFSDKLAQLGVPHALAAYHGTHGDHVRERFERHVLPFFSITLEQE